MSTVSPVAITVAHGDGIGPEIMSATLRIMEAAGAALNPEFITIGEAAYQQGHSAGITPNDWESLRRTGIFLKAPITTPQGGGFKSLNVTIRKTLGLYANVRPCRTYTPYVASKHPDMNVVIIRENEEDLYAGIEHRQTTDVVQCLKLITRPGSEKIIRYAFEYARANGRKKVSCFSKDNIMKQTDGLFHQIFNEIAAEYPDIQNDHWIVDIGFARLADTPEIFDVVVTANLYGDILSDIAAQIAGSVGLAGSANIGQHCAMFEAIHGSAPPLAGQNIANPSGLLQASVMMLVHIGQAEVANRIHNAWLRTLEDGIHTQDIFQAATSREQVGTDAFADAVIARLGQSPQTLPPVHYVTQAKPFQPAPYQRPTVKKELLGADVFIDNGQLSPEALASALQAAMPPVFKLSMISNRGVKVWPEGHPETFCTDHWRCRFLASEGEIGAKDLVTLLGALVEHSLDIIKTENLYSFDGVRGYSLGQGE